MWWSEKNCLLSKSFNGFRRDRSCSDCLAGLHLDSLVARERGELLGVLSLDLEGAYDKVNLEVLLRTLRDLGIPSMYTTFIFNLIYNRKIIGSFNK